MFNKNKKNNKGFTLVELLVVIAIIGILAVVAVPSLMKNIEKSKVASLEADINAIKSASVSYYADKNTYPTPANGVVADTTGIKSPFDTLLDGGLANKYKATYKVSGTAPGEYKLIIEIPNGGIGKEALDKLKNDLGVTSTGSPIEVTLIKGDE